MEVVEFPPALRLFRRLHHRSALSRPLPSLSGSYTCKQDEQQVRHTFNKLHLSNYFNVLSSKFDSDEFKQHGHFYFFHIKHI